MARWVAAMWSAAMLWACSPDQPGPPPGRCGVAGECGDGLVCDLPSFRCVTPARAECTAPPCREPVAELRAEPLDRLDLLIVMDNSGAQITQQPTLDGMATLLDRLARRPGGLPDLHVGVVSTDMGTGPYNIAGCEGRGDDGALQNAPRNAGCTAPEEAFLFDDGVARNYEGDLAEAIACIGRLGIDGCGYERALDALRRALDGSQPINDGFLRDDAALLVLITGDEDDCSASDPELYTTDPELDALDSELGPLGSFRCFEFGVLCAESDDPRAPGPRTECRSYETSPYLTPVTEYVAFARGLKEDLDDLAVVGIIGDVAPVAVQTTMRGPTLEPSCAADFGKAAPGIRLATFVRAFPTRNAIASACGDYEPTMTAIASTAMHTLGSACLTRPIRPGRDCVAEILTRDASATVDAAPIPECVAGGTRPCFSIETDADRCGGFEQALRFSVEPATGVQPPARARLRCMLAE